MKTDSLTFKGTPIEALREKASQAYASQSRDGIEERWILDNLPMVRRIAQKVAPYLSNNDIDMEDIISAGTVGLVKAARAFDPNKVAEFKTYAYIRVRGAIIDELRSRSFVPSPVYNRIKNIEATYRRFLGQRGVPPDDAELAEASGISRKQLYRTLQEARKQTFLSIHNLTDGASGLDVLGLTNRVPGPDVQAERNELLTRLSKAIRELPRNDRIIMLLYYERDLTMKDIAKTLSISEPRVSQLHASALFKLSINLG